MNSSQIQTAMKHYCDKNGYFYSKVQPCTRGLPDTMVCIDSVIYMFEVKSGKDVEKPAQKLIRRILNSRKEISFVVYSVQEFIEIVEKIIKNSKEKS